MLTPQLVLQQSRGDRARRSIHISHRYSFSMFEERAPQKQFMIILICFAVDPVIKLQTPIPSHFVLGTACRLLAIL